MSRTTEVMKEHLRIAEKYIKAIDKAESKSDFMNAIKTCRDDVKKQYGDLEEIADDFCDKIANKKDAELQQISEQTGDIFGSRITAYYGKMAPYMADQDFMQALSEFDAVIGSSPLFGKNEFGENVAVQVSTAMAGGMDKVATQLLSETTDSEGEHVQEIADIVNKLVDLSRRYVSKMEEAVTGRKLVTATENYVSAIEKIIPEMRNHIDMLKLLMSKKDKPEAITKPAEELKVILGEQLKDALKYKSELLTEPKVKKAVAKLGDVLRHVPF